MIKELADIFTTISHGTSNGIDNTAKETHLTEVNKVLKIEIQKIAVNVDDTMQEPTEAHLLLKEGQIRMFLVESLNGGSGRSRTAVFFA